MSIRPELAGLHFILEVARVRTVFQTCSGLGSTSEIIEHRELDQTGKEVTRKIPGRLKWSNLALKRGVDVDNNLWTWRQLVVDGKVVDARKTGLVELRTADGKLLKRWEFTRGWPCAWQASSDEDTSGIVIERIEIAHEGLRML